MRPLDLPDPFESRPWPLPGPGTHDAFNTYCEVFWLPHIGPTSFLLARRLLVAPGPWSKAVLAAALGVGANGPNSALERSLVRLEAFRLATVVDGTILVRSRWQRLPDRLLAKLPEEIRRIEPGMAAA